MPNDIANNMADTIHFLEEENASIMKSLTDLQLAYNEQMIELREAKRLLKLAVEDMNGNNICYDINACYVCTKGKCVVCDGFKWRYTDDVDKLLKQ